MKLENIETTRALFHIVFITSAHGGYPLTRILASVSNVDITSQNPVLEDSFLYENYLKDGQVIQRTELKCSHFSLSIVYIK